MMNSFLNASHITVLIQLLLVLWAKFLRFMQVLDTVTKTENTSTITPLQYGLFKQVLKKIKVKYYNLITHTEVWWLNERTKLGYLKSPTPLPNTGKIIREVILIPGITADTYNNRAMHSKKDFNGFMKLSPVMFYVNSVL